MSADGNRFTRVARLADLRPSGCHVVQAGGHTLALLLHAGRVYAVDNRCPHMGFPLSQGTVKDGILTCHWHHARFDLATGGTFDLFADDVRAFPAEVRGDDVWVDLTPRDPAAAADHQRERLRDGLERDIPLVISKAVLALAEAGDGRAFEPFSIGLDFGTRYREAGWGQGLTILTCMANLLPFLAFEDHPRALYQGLAAVARDTAGSPPRFAVRPLPGAPADLPTLKRWFRQFVEVRDAEGAERALVSAVRAASRSGEVDPAARPQIAALLFAAATDHRYLQIGHVLDFTNKAFEALDLAGWETGRVEQVLTSLVAGYANADRMEESNAWRNPVDLVALVEAAFEALPAAPEPDGRAALGQPNPLFERLTPVLLGDDPAESVQALLAALQAGHDPAGLAGTVAYAAALRIASFPTSNEFGDWDTALHTFTFAHAVHQGLRRSGAPELRRGIFDAAMSVYLDRFLNVPAAPLPTPDGRPEAEASAVLGQLPALLDRQQQVDAAGERVAHYLYASHPVKPLLALLGKLLLREDRDFHTIQTVEAAFRQYGWLSEAGGPADPAAVNVLIAAARYLAAHAPTMRAQGQTYQIAVRLARGERLFEG